MRKRGRLPKVSDSGPNKKPERAMLPKFKLRSNCVASLSQLKYFAIVGKAGVKMFIDIEPRMAAIIIRRGIPGKALGFFGVGEAEIIKEALKIENK